MDLGFLGNSKYHMLVCAKVSSWVRKFLHIAKAHMFLNILQCDAAFVASAASVSQVSTIQAGDLARASTPERNHFLHTSLPQIGTRTQLN